MDLRLVRLTADTAPLLAAAAGEILDNPVDPVQLAAFLADPRHLMLLAVADGRAVGMASATELLHPDKPPQMFINEVGVAEAFQRRGIGRRLVSALVEAARARGCSYVWLGTAADNLAGQRCFAAAGADGPPETFLLFAWDFEG